MQWLGDVIVEPEEPNVQNFFNVYDPKNLIKEKIYFKNPNNPSSIDLKLSNRKNIP